ncbi:hypothetical protein [Thiomonas sp.]
MNIEMLYAQREARRAEIVQTVETLTDEQRRIDRQLSAFWLFGLMAVNPGWKSLRISADSRSEYDDEGGYFTCWDASYRVKLESPQDVHHDTLRWDGNTPIPEAALTLDDPGSEEEIADALHQRLEDSSVAYSMAELHPGCHDIVWEIRRADVLDAPESITLEWLEQLFSRIASRQEDV